MDRRMRPVHPWPSAVGPPKPGLSSPCAMLCSPPTWTPSPHCPRPSQPGKLPSILQNPLPRSLSRDPVPACPEARRCPRAHTLGASPWIPCLPTGGQDPGWQAPGPRSCRISDAWDSA